MSDITKKNLTLRQGDTFRHTFLYVASDGSTIIDMTGYSARLQIRDSVDSSSYHYEAVSGGDITISGVAGSIALSIPAADTAAFTFVRAVYDLEVTDAAGNVTTIVEGVVKRRKQVTR